MNKFIENQTILDFNTVSLQEAIDILEDTDTPESKFYMGYSDGTYKDEQPIYSQYADDPDYKAGYQHAVEFDAKLQRHEFLLKKYYEIKNKHLVK